MSSPENTEKSCSEMHPAMAGVIPGSCCREARTFSGVRPWGVVSPPPLVVLDSVELGSVDVVVPGSPWDTGGRVNPGSFGSLVLVVDAAIVELLDALLPDAILSTSMPQDAASVTASATTRASRAGDRLAARRRCAEGGVGTELPDQSVGTAQAAMASVNTFSERGVMSAVEPSRW